MSKIYNVNKTLILILLCIISVSSNLFSQSKYNRKISISEWVAEMEKAKSQEYWLDNTEIYFDKDIDTLYSYKQSRNKPTEADKKNEKNIFPSIIIANCKLPVSSTCQIRNLIFHNNITFANCEGAAQIFIYNCTFKQGLDFHVSDLNAIQFMYCTIQQRIVVNELKTGILSFSYCSFYTDQKVVNSKHRFGDEFRDKPYQYLFRIRQNENKITAFYMEECELLPAEITPIILFNGGKYDVIGIDGINFQNSIVEFNNCSVKENFMVRNCKFKMPFGMYHFNFPADNTSFNWSQLDSVGLGLYYDYANPFTRKTDTLISDVDLYNELNSSYRKFFIMYRARGDIESANACYIQMKDMETKKYRHLYKNDAGIHKWFNWRFNQFLKYFSEYGTNPVQSLIISMWTILIFAAVYFFFYSDWDGINRTFLIKQHWKIMLYFKSEQRLEDFYTENYIEDFKTFADYKTEMKKNKNVIPVFIILLGKPLYLLSVIKHKILTFIYRRTEVLQGRWTDLKPSRKIYVGFAVFVSITIYIVYLGLIRALNSTTLSINVFSTLGFGAIPVKGISRYITILEGFLGWFLLSIFSVSLISQMVQN